LKKLKGSKLSIAYTWALACGALSGESPRAAQFNIGAWVR
jgi:hypothetical protein